MEEVRSYLQRGKLGDFIHSLVVCKFVYETYNYKANLYITGNEFETGLEFTYKELEPILSTQEWLNEFKIYNGEKIDYNLSNFRSSKFLYNRNWIELYFNEFLNGQTPPKEYKWIELPKEESLSNTMLINRSVRPMSKSVQQFYRKVLDDNKDLEVGFICFEESQHSSFIYKNECKLIKVNTLYEFFKKINSCKLYVGNQSGPSAWATSMNVPRILELMNAPDAIHYMKDLQYYSNFNYFKDTGI